MLVFDREERHLYKFIVTALINSEVIAYTDIFVTIGDENDNCPYFEFGLYNNTVTEYYAVGQTVADTLAIDLDESGTLTYSLKGDMEDEFIISQFTGLITLNVSPHNLDRSGYVMLATVSDGGYPPCSATTTVSIAVDVGNPINAKPPKVPNTRLIVQGYYNLALPEISAPRTATTDLHVGPFISYPISQLRYYITSGDPDDVFSISKNGKLTNTRYLDHEQQAYYDLGVDVFEYKKYMLGHINISVTVVDANDNTPVFISLDAPLDVSVGTPKSKPIAVVKAFDDDSTSSGLGKVTYELMSNKEDFEIESTSGQLFVKNEIVSVKSYVLTIVARDQGVPSLYSSIDLNIRTFDPVNGAPVFDSLFYEGFVPETAGHGSLVATVSIKASEKRKKQPVQYEIVGGSGRGKFYINKETVSISSLSCNIYRFKSTVNL